MAPSSETLGFTIHVNFFLLTNYSVVFRINRSPGKRNLIYFPLGGMIVVVEVVF